MTKADSELFFQLDQDPEVMRFLNGGKPSTMTEINEIFIPRMERYLNKQKGWGDAGAVLDGCIIFQSRPRLVHLPTMLVTYSFSLACLYTSHTIRSWCCIW